MSDTYYSKNREARITYQKDYYQRNKDKIKEYYSSEEAKAKRAIYMKEYLKKYRSRKPIEGES